MCECVWREGRGRYIQWVEVRGREGEWGGNKETNIERGDKGVRKERKERRE